MTGLERAFGELYLKEKNLKPEFCEVSIDYGRMAVHVSYRLKEGGLQEDVMDLDSAWGLLAKRILRIEESLMID